MVRGVVIFPSWNNNGHGGTFTMTRYKHFFAHPANKYVRCPPPRGHSVHSKTVMLPPRYHCVAETVRGNAYVDLH